MAIVHYASLIVKGIDVIGRAELVNGSGYLFRAEGERKATLVSYNDPHLLLYGRCDLADTQLAADGDRVRTCSQTLVPDDGQLALFAEREVA